MRTMAELRRSGAASASSFVAGGGAGGGVSVPVEVSSPGGGGSAQSIVTFRIVSIEAQVFVCRLWGDPDTADTVAVRAVMRNDPADEAFTLAEAHPPYFVGQDIRAHRRPDFDEGADWWAIDTFTFFGCESTE